MHTPTIRGFILVAVSVFMSPSNMPAICVSATSFCEKLPDANDNNKAIFLGLVKAVNYPLVRFDVIEPFTSVAPGLLELQIKSDMYIDNHPVGGISPHIGDTWLVEAILDQHTHQWVTSQCLRTKPLQQAKEDVDTLRLWLSGRRNPGRVRGEVFNPATKTDLPDVKVYLHGQGQQYSTVTNTRGEFLFENVEVGTYEITSPSAVPNGSSTVDLTHAWCSPHLVLIAH